MPFKLPKGKQALPKICLHITCYFFYENQSTKLQ
jgi:hypothetical protein